ncbi:nucleotidyl transferase AbiEii/AbiGii toxin family protein [Streptantibioticus ferralitis]|uniref:Nucleotidyl transferase AbiEii/AbiGii toxin family protein n=1 Tax=Streptantibioticus ferralitis TaxID=236510 RepID=A0ABT5Z6W9_9ACTN|nr:nucleotidyl transferase AbiEii/AbiGii toxin family protein [Streptantibioticus ferralitis]MDF2259494.1 nucleotidyl transferase AbiEii/AbiGii toxin family protein [Streptantibioticus ferralitis]
METAHKAAIARTALAACAEHGYAVAGSLALRLHQVEDSREPDDIDLFTNKLVDGEAVRGGVRAALEAAGYQTEQLVAWSEHPDGVGPQNAKLRVSHPEQGSVVIDMVRAPRYMPATQLDGMPVRAVPELLYSKLQALDNRVAAKDFIDLAALQARMGDRSDGYLAQYVNGYGTKVRRMAPEQFAEELRGRLGQIQQLPDEAFAAYGLAAEQSSRVRESVNALADRLTPVSARAQQQPDQSISASQQPRPHDQSLSDDAARQMAALSDQQLTTWREQTTQTLRQAEAMVRHAPDEQALAQARQFVDANLAQIQGIDTEISRRAQSASAQPRHGQAAHVVQAAVTPGPQTASPDASVAPDRSNSVSADAQWLSQYRDAVINHAVTGRGDESARDAMRRLTEQADLVAARAYPDPHSAPRIAHEAAQPLLRTLATAPPVGANGTLPLQLLPDDALAQRHARLARAYQAAGQAGLPQSWQQGQLAHAEMQRRQQLSPGQRAAEDGVRESLQAARRARPQAAGPDAARALGPRGVPQAQGIQR